VGRALEDRLGRHTLLIVCAALLLSSCNKRSADEAIQAAEQALASAPEVAADVPEQFAEIGRILKDARASYAAGRYTEALRAAQALPDRIASARALAARRRAEKLAVWEAMAREVPPRIEALTARLSLLVSGGWIASERQATAEAELAALGEVWGRAKAKADAGQLAQALALGEAVKSRAVSLAGTLGLKPLLSSTPPGVARKEP
jgi:hypothetical protein